MSRRALCGAALALSLAWPASATPWKPVAKGDGWVSSTGTIRASQSPQPPEKVLAVAKAFSGIPYTWAGHEPSGGFDCSGYVYEVLRLNGYSIARMADGQFDETKRVAYKDLQPGDLVFFHTYLPGPSHVGFYLGAGDFIHASSAAEGVVVSQMTSGYYRERFLGGGRPAGWEGETLRVADVVEPAQTLASPVALKAVKTVKAVEPEAALSTEPYSNNPFSRHRTPQPVRVSVDPPSDTTAEVAVEDWKVMLGETVAVAKLQLDSLVKGFSTALGMDRST